MKNITNCISDCFAKDNFKNNSRKMNSEDNSCSSDKIEETTPNGTVITRNAFQVMMDSRHKVIGSNSPGKLIQVSENDEKSNKETLVARKKLFNNWSETKGGAKRRRYEEDKDEIIKSKLNKRSKRLKKMLQVESKSECFSDDSDDVVKKKARRRIRTLSCSSDTGNLPVTMECDDGKRRLNFKGIFKKEEATIPLSSPSKFLKKNENSQDTSSNFVNELNKTQNDLTDFEPKNNSKSKINNDCDNSKKLSKKNYKHKKESKSGSIGNELSKETFSSRWKIKINLKDEDSDSSQHSSVTTNENESNSNGDEILITSGSDEDNLVSNKRKTLKVAPVFTKATPKPKLDPVILEARRQFLMSGAPPGLKKLEKQFSVIEKEVELFPSISHIRQKCTSSLWTLPIVKLKLKENLPLVISKSDLNLSDLTSKMNMQVQIKLNNEKMGKIQRILKIIKQNNPDYPVYRSFKRLQEKNQQSMIKISSNRKAKERNFKSKNQLTETTESDILEYAMWTEKYRARSSEDIIGNSAAVKSLKKWLENWKNFSQEINCKKRQRNNSSSEFELTDWDSTDSWRLPGNTLILKGPPGSGKSNAVYAICEELGLNIIEINASSKRTGKKLMQELQEATQSHQVRKNKLSNFTTSKLGEEKNSQEIKRMCVLLVEDIDIVFDQDEGFIYALNQLIMTSKRPIIMTTTDYESVLLKKISTEHELISFFSIHSSSLSVWLQILCLIEGQLVNKDDIGILLDFNKGDVRKTLLELQFWVQSGGQLTQNENPVKIEYKDESCEEFFQSDENIKLTKEKSESSNKCFEHKNCVKSFLVFQKDEYFTIPYCSNVDFLWWNISNLLNLPDLTYLRIKKSKNENKSISQNKPISKLGFKALCNFYDSLCLTDIVRIRNNYFENTHMITSNRSVIKDGLELTEKFIDFNNHQDFTHEITHFLLNKSIKRYSCIENTTVKLNVGVPVKFEKRWREEQHNYQTAFEEIISCSNSIDRRSIALDYLPTLRTMARLESDKIMNNTKRGNRFRSYFKDLGLKCNENLTKWACNVLHE